MGLTTERTDLDSLVKQVGEVQANPTAFTVLDRLKTIGSGGGASNFTANNSTNVDLSKVDLDDILIKLINLDANLINIATRYTVPKSYFLTLETGTIAVKNAYRTIAHVGYINKVILLLDPSNDFTFEHELLVVHADTSITNILGFNDGASYQNISVSGKNHELAFNVHIPLVVGDKLCYRINCTTTTYLYTCASFEVSEY